MNKKTIKKDFKEFINTFKKINKRYLYIISFDILFILLFFIGMMSWNSLMMEKAQGLQALQQFQPGVDEAAMESTLASMQGFFSWLIITFIILSFLLLIVYSFTQGMIWLKIYKKKANIKFMKKFFLLNLLCVPFYLILIGIASLFVSKLTSFCTSVIYSFITPHLTTFFAVLVTIFVLGPILVCTFNTILIVYMHFMQKNEIFKSIKRAFSLIFSRWKKLYTPYVLITLLILAVSVLILVLRSIPMLYIVVATILALVFLAWLRLYVKELVEK